MEHQWQQFIQCASIIQEFKNKKTNMMSTIPLETNYQLFYSSSRTLKLKRYLKTVLFQQAFA